VSPAGERPFALVPRRRFVGVRFGQHRSPRRGQGDEVAGTRPYRPGDRPTWIDWPASARLSAARGTDEFVVREFFADTAPLVALVVDRRPRMELYGPPLPWLDKPAATAAAIAAIGRATAAAGGELAYVEQRGAQPRWLSAGPPLTVLDHVEAHSEAHASATGPSSLDGCLLALVRHASSFPAGTFVFVVSDFIDAVSPGIWLKLRALRWDVTPVVVQDPTWEQSFPDVGGVLLPVRDAGSGEVGEILLSGREARARAHANEGRLESALGVFARLGFDPVVLGSSERSAIAEGFDRWASRRRRLRRRSA
jgi:uncharacterized protein (DUF58 family)